VFKAIDLSVTSPAPGVNRLREATERFGESVPGDMELRGWRWGDGDRVQSWGENVVTEAFDAGPGYGRLLYFTFDANGGPNESHLSVGDSGGGVFVQNAAGQWKLAGTNWLVDGPFRDEASGPSYLAALFDVGGLYVSDPPTFVPDSGTDIPSGGYASSVSAQLPFILNTINAPVGRDADIPEPALSGATFVAVTLLLAGRRWNGPLPRGISHPRRPGASARR
jgi:hypothetical protein